MQDIKVEVKNLGSKSKQNFIYKDINFSIKSGEIVGLLGHNGAGKSTILRNIANLEIPYTGEVYINNQKNDINVLNKNIVLIPDTIKLFKSLSIDENLELLSINYNYDKKFYNDYLKKMKLKKSDIVGDLSKGNQEMVQLIILLSLNCDVVVLDEPFSAIDIFRREVILQMIIQANLNEKSIIITTHLINEIQEILTRVLYLDDGKIIIDKNIEEIQEQYVDLVSYVKDLFRKELI